MNIEVPQNEREIFLGALRALNGAGIRYVVAGAFCMHYYTGIWRYTKDMDFFALPEAVPSALNVLAKVGYKTWIEADHWLGKAVKNGCIVDVIFGSGNWLSPIDEQWLVRAKPAELFGEAVLMSPIEEMIWAKSYIAGRERFDGADVCHLIMASSGQFDWRYLVQRYGDHWQLLLSYLNLYAFVYPANKQDVPEWVLDELNERAVAQRKESYSTKRKICRGTLLDRFMYNHDVEQLGYVDPREKYARQQGGKKSDVALEREWAREKLARGEVYKETC